MSVASLANRTYGFERQTTTKDAVGGQTKAWASSATVKGRVQPLSGTDQIIHARNESRVTHKGYFTGTPDILAGDRVQVGSQFLHVAAVRNVDYADSFVTVELEERDQ